MSSYQYYEFLALDGAISAEAVKYGQSLSSRAEVSARRWRNVYNFGDFRGNTKTLLKHYDAHFYIASWGTTHFGLAFPKGYLTREAIEPYLRNDHLYQPILSVDDIDGRLIVWWQKDEEGGWGWTEGDGLIDQLIGIREELIRGDHRALFLGWLADFDFNEEGDPRDGNSLMPPIPAGLDRLSHSLNALVEQFPVDPDAITVAAGLSKGLVTDRRPVEDLLEEIPVSELRAWLRRVADGDGSRVMAELNRLTVAPADAPIGQVITCADFAAKLEQVREARLKKEAQEEAKKAKQKAKERRRHLDSVLMQADMIWAGLDPLMDEKIASAYDRAASQLQELRDAYDQAGSGADFQQRLVAFRSRYSRRAAMLRRIETL